MRLPLVELAKPENLVSAQEYVAPPCTADGLVSKLIADLVQLTVRTGETAISLIIRLFS